MSAIFVDTNVVLRLVDKSAPEHTLVKQAVSLLEQRGVTLTIGLQVLVEAWVVATRPKESNGLGWSPDHARIMSEGFLARFACLSDDQTTQGKWLELVAGIPIVGKRAHDARIAALMLSHGLSQILTLNVKDFEGLPSIDGIASFDCHWLDSAAMNDATHSVAVRLPWSRIRISSEPPFDARCA